MFHDLFNRYLKQSQGYEHLKDHIHQLEREVDHLRRKEVSSPLSQPPRNTNTNTLSFPSTITINLNKKDNDTSLKAFTKKMNKPSRLNKIERKDGANKIKFLRSLPLYRAKMIQNLI